MKYIVYWYDKNEEYYGKKNHLYSSDVCDDLEEARMYRDRLWCNQTTAVIKDLDNNIIEVDV